MTHANFMLLHAIHVMHSFRFRSVCCLRPGRLRMVPASHGKETDCISNMPALCKALHHAPSHVNPEQSSFCPMSMCVNVPPESSTAPCLCYVEAEQLNVQALHPHKGKRGAGRCSHGVGRCRRSKPPLWSTSLGSPPPPTPRLQRLCETPKLATKVR